MNGNIVITIGRETGSGGRRIGQMLAERMGVKCYDKELIQLAAKESGLCQEVFEAYDEKPTNSFLYSLVMDTYSGNFGAANNLMNNLPLNHKVFLAQFETIKNLALRESCVIVGRCADYALADYPNTTSIFISGDMEDKIGAISRRYGKMPEEAKSIIVKTDKKRANYYNFYSGKKWGDARSYELCINSSMIGYEGCVDLVLDYVEKKKQG
jgi:cytidylate kinase